LDAGRPDRLIEPEPEDQLRGTCAHGSGGGARTSVVDGRPARGEGGRVIHRADEFHVVEMIEFGQIVGPSADQQPLA
jgi:hypothetical protein